MKFQFKMRSISNSIIGLLIFTSLLSCEKKNIELVKNRGTSYEILTIKNATEKEKHAATELQHYLEKISSVKIPIVDENNQNTNKRKITVKKLNINPNEVSIKTSEGNLIIGGGSENATLNAVYEFLEIYLNCRWYAPNEMVIPESKSIEIPKIIAYNYTPEITTRTVHSRLFYKNEGFAAKQKVTTIAFPNYVPSARVHTFHKFIPEEKFFKEHPEYFAFRNNKRIPTQLCLTNPTVFKIVRDSVASLFKRNPNSSVVSVSQNDNQQYCTCNNCSAIDSEEGSPSGTMIQFVNKIAAEFPDKTISTLAYQYTRKPSKTKPNKNVLITLCSIECDRSAPILEKCNDFADDIIGWHNITNNIRIWDYTTQFTNFLAPFPNIHTLQPNIKFFRDNHAKWVFEQHSNNPSELFELRSYITAKLLWNPDLNIEHLITDFTDGYYEEAGVYIKNYIDLIHKKIKEDPNFFLFLYGDPSQAFSSYLNPENLKTYDTFFDSAEKAIGYKKEILQRVKKARLSIDYAILEACRKGISKNYSLLIKDDKGNRIVNPLVIAKLESFYNTCSKANITLMNEMRFTVQEYYDSYKKAIEVASKPNIALGTKVSLLTKPKKYANEDPQVLTDGSLGGNNFYANWLGFEGNNLEAVIDLGSNQNISSVSTAFLQVVNHVVFYPLDVNYYYSNDNKVFYKLGTIKNDEPLSKKSKINAIKYFDLNFKSVNARFIKIIAKNMNEPPYWHHATGTPSWVFADEIIIN